MENNYETVCLCALNSIFGYEPRVASALIENLGSASAVFEMSDADKDAVFGPYSKYRGKIVKKDLDAAEAVLQRLRRDGTVFVGITSDEYPKRLKGCEDAPLGIFVRSDSPVERIFAGTEHYVAVVGTREITPYGEQWCRDIVALSDGSVYAWFGSESGDKIMIYRYDPDAVIEVTEELTLYTVEESFFLQQAAVQYHKQHPEILIHVDAAISMTDKYSGNADYQQIYQDLNTSLTSGNGPDLMVMDHLKLDTYASKGLLLDLQEILQPMEEDGTLLSNITTAYKEADGTRYAVPLQFGLLLAVGRDVQPEEMSSMDAIAKAVSGKTESYMGDRTCGELVEEFYPLIVDDILQNRQVNRDTLRPWLEDLKKIADNCGILPSRKEGRAANIWDLGSDVKLVLQETDGFNEAMMPYAVAELLNANVVSMENAFYPKMVIGINSRSEHVETAKDFLRFALSEELQSVDTYEGFPVNAKALETQAAADRSMAEAYTTYDIDGSTAEFAIKSYSEETANHLMELCRAATLCLKEDTQIETSLTESLQAYLNGQASVEEAMDAVEGSLKMYLAE